MMTNYQEQSLAGATGVELVVALYNGLVRFLYQALACIDEGDIRGRRISVKKALDIVMYLQARLRLDLGGETAASLSDFYAAIFTMTLEASHEDSHDKMEEVIQCVRSVREAWIIAARDPEAGRVLPRELRTQEERFLAPAVVEAVGEPASAGWSA
ncbi:flagellar export chaperone FliS [Edaphobacter flagellatus]|uniref:flagellar export chaperone FliS n=1 Tax=Edaphobacter flagellatus TaxID=1933044 RepID=UPI0021B39EFB|nr:flagellar export chaperone FliS [Edaphobacter flagellatus]